MEGEQKKNVIVGINGPGAIGRDFLYTTIENPAFGINVAAFNDYEQRLFDLVKLLRTNSVYGPWLGRKIEIIDGTILINGGIIRYSKALEPKDIPWEETEVSLVIESSRRFNDPAKAKDHLRTKGPKRVVISAPPKGKKCPIFVYGVNHKEFEPEKDDVVSAASCSTNCLVPAVFVLDRAFGLEYLGAQSTHSATGEDEAYDRMGGKRQILDNIVPDKTGAAKTLFEVLPGLKERLSGVAVVCNRVPVTTGSVFDIFAVLKKEASANEVAEAFKLAAREGDLREVIKYTEDGITAADVRGELYGAVVSAASIQVDRRIVRLQAFYDNIRGFNGQMARLIRYIGHNS